MRVAIQKLSGVESVDVSLERAAADVRLRAGNGLTLPQLRSIIKNNGFTAKDTTITAIGKIIERNGGPAFQISGIDTVLILAADSKAPAAFTEARRRLERKDLADVEVIGLVGVGAANAVDHLVVSSLRPVHR